MDLENMKGPTTPRVITGSRSNARNETSSLFLMEREGILTKP
jgi:hypothetical protein